MCSQKSVVFFRYTVHLKGGNVMQFLITAYDGREEGHLARRMAVRPQHLENMRKLQAAGNVKTAGGILDENGELAGSFLVMEFESREKLDGYLREEPYVQAGVWKDIRIETCHVVIGAGSC